VDYDKHGDWMFDKAAIDPSKGSHTAEEVYDQNYVTPKK